MRLRFTVPLVAYITGPSPDSLNLTARFRTPDVSVVVTLARPPLHEPLEAPELPAHSRYFIQSSGIRFELDELAPAAGFLRILVGEAARANLVTLLVGIANRTLIAVRNFGIVPHVSEIRPEPDEVEQLLRGWQVQVDRESADVWEDLVPPPADLGALAWLALRPSTDPEPRPEIRATAWPDIAEAIEDALTPSPEREFLTNAVEHARIGNLRLALLEAIICLEIVLSQFLHEYLSRAKGLSQTQISSFLTPKVDLSARLAGLLDLTLQAGELEGIDLAAVRSGVRWRNKITHETGHLPKGVSDEQVRASIVNVLSLAQFLGRKRDQLTAAPELHQLSQRLASELGVLAPRIDVFPSHRVWVEFLFILPGNVPNEDRLNEIVLHTAGRLRERDGRFDADQHLFVRFLSLPQKVHARWSRGRLHVVE